MKSDEVIVEEVDSEILTSIQAIHNINPKQLKNDKFRRNRCSSYMFQYGEEGQGRKSFPAC